MWSCIFYYGCHQFNNFQAVHHEQKIVFSSRRHSQIAGHMHVRIFILCLRLYMQVFLKLSMFGMSLSVMQN